MKNKLHNRILSVLLAAIMMLTVVPTSIFATENGQSGSGGQNASTPNSVADGQGSEEPKTITALTYIGWDWKEKDEFKDLGLNNDVIDMKDGTFVINTPQALKRFAENVNNGTTYEGAEIRLTQNIDYANIDYAGETWTPVGVSAAHPFMGIFDGGCHEVINLNISYDSQQEADDETYYVGFFGYVEYANICNFGIYNYTIDQTYNYDTEIGAMVAHAVNTQITDCYANGEIKAAFEDINPLDRGEGNVDKYNYVPNELTSDDKYGRGVIIDLRDVADGVEEVRIGTTMTISGNVSAVRILGKEGVTYTDFNIVVSGHAYFSMLLEFQNFSMLSDSNNGAIYCASDRRIYIVSSGTANRICAMGFAPAINALNSAITLEGTGSFEVVGGDGLDGEEIPFSEFLKGIPGEDGQAAIVCERLHIDLNNTFTAQGGNGGDGVEGYTGAEGETNDDYSMYKKIYGIFGTQIQALYRYAKAFEGGTGGTGGNGGNGGLPLDCQMTGLFRNIYLEGPPQHKDKSKFITQIIAIVE